MSTVRAAFNISATIVKSLVKVAGFGFVADAIEGGQELYQLACSLKDETFGSAEAQMSGALRNSITDELASIEDQLGRSGRNEKSIDLFIGRLETSTKRTIARLLDDDNALCKSITEAKTFHAYVLKQSTQVRANYTPEERKYLDSLLHCVAREYLILAPKSPNYNKAVLKATVEELSKILTALEELKDGQQELKNGQQEIKNGQQQLKSSFESLRTTIENERTIRHNKQLNNDVWGSRPATLKHWIERDPTSNGTTLHDTIFSSPSSQRGSRCVLVGRAGSGKTSLAASIASRCESDTWSLVAWIDASTRSNIESGLIALGEAILGTHTNVHQEQRIRIEQVLASFKRFGKNNCLFVYDNVEGLDYLDGVLPVGPGVHIVVTTRRSSGWSNQKDWNIFSLGNFSRDESVTHLLRVTKDTDQTTASKLASYLGDLPLAIAQAAATCSKYYSNLREYYADLQATNIEELLEPIEGGHYSKGAIASLQLATHSALNFMKDPLVKKEAEGILAVLCYLAESGVPTKWLEYNNGLPSRKAFKLLQDASIIDQSADGSTTMLHRLQAQALRESWREEEREQACESAATLLGSVDIDRFRADDSDARFLETRNLIEHLRAFGAQDCFHCLRDYRHFTSALCRAFTHARDLGLVPEVFALKGLVNTLRKQVGDSREILSLLAKLAYADMYMGDYPDAIKLYKHILSTREQILEPNHRDILSTRNDLAYAYYWEGNTGKAIDLFEQVLDDRTRILRSDHEDMLMTGSYLALAYADDGQLERAITLGEQVVKDRDRVLKPDHKYTLVTRNNLADAYKSVGRLTDAIKMYEYVLEARIRTLGNTHHHTRITRNDLAQTYEQAGDLPKAISMYEDLHNDYIQMYGPDHESTIEVRDRLEAAKHELEQQEKETPDE
mgnify:FL=1